MPSQLVNVPCGKARPGETAPRRNAKLKNLEVLKRPVGFKANTVYEFAVEAFEKNKKRNAIAYRDIDNVIKETKKVKKMINGEETEVDKTWFYYQLSDYKYETYGQLNKIFHDYGKGLAKIGLSSATEDKIHIFASTSAKWMKTFLAAQSQSLPVVTAYDTLGEKGLIHSLKQTEPKAIFTDNALLSNLINPLKECDSVKYIIHSESLNSSDKRQDGELYRAASKAIEKIKEVRADIQVVSIDDVIELGRKETEIQTNPPKPSDISCIMYTSGSTGDPKGVVLKHENIVAGVAGVSFVVGKEFVGPTDRIIAFLPLAHIFELVFELIGFYWGGTLGYANVKTLSSSSVRNCLGDMQAFKPTIMVGVAAVWETIKKGILAQIEKASPLAQKVFWGAYNYKKKKSFFKIPGANYIIENYLFKKVKQATGGQLRYTLNGGSPLSKDTQVFLTTMIAPMLIGYGLTETVANTTVLSPHDFEFDVQGALSGAVTVKLIDVPDAGYLAENNQGEILIRGLPVTSEYYKNTEETSSAFDKEGWFMTGDVGEWTATGQLKIIDRKKNMVKTLNGEYIALEKLESIYRSSPYVQNICCYADQNHAKPIGIIVPNKASLKQLGIEEKIVPLDASNDSYSDLDELYELTQNKKIASVIHKSLVSTARSQGLVGIELIAGIIMVDEEWSPQNGFLSSAQKLQRKKILAANKERVDALYKSV